ncbi:MAG: phospholipase D-like domain-containing protein [Kofleriaceae bacterium]
MRRVVLLFALLAACRGDTELTLDARASDAPADGVDGTGCTTLTPRATPVEAFVGPTGLQDRVNALIDGAQHSLDLQMYLFTVKDIANHIVAAKQRGVAVRLILDPDEAGNNSVYGIFNAGGVAWKNASPIYSYSHAKYLIVDRSIAQVMSMNFNASAMDQERNYGFVDRDPEDVTDVQTIFDQDWALANGTTPAVPDLSCTRLIISPVNAGPRILAHINSAQTTLDVEVLYITDASIRNAVANAKGRGVAVRVILEDPNDTPDNAGIAAYFASAGIPVKYAFDQFYLHAKLIVADGVAFVGSENMSPTSLTRNREVGALVFEPEQAAIIQAQFEADWAITTPAM